MADEPTPMIPIRLPYDLKHDQLNLEAAPSQGWPSLQRMLDDLQDITVLCEEDDESINRILLSAVILKAANPDATMSACIGTARIWEFG